MAASSSLLFFAVPVAELQLGLKDKQLVDEYCSSSEFVSMTFVVRGILSIFLGSLLLSFLIWQKVYRLNDGLAAFVPHLVVITFALILILILYHRIVTENCKIGDMPRGLRALVWISVFSAPLEFVVMVLQTGYLMATRRDTRTL